MGLDTSHGAWNGSYSTFNNFRRWLAEKINLNLDSFEGYKGIKSWDSFEHKLKALLRHSDCDGILTPEECKDTADGLTALIDSMVPDNEPFSFYRKAVQFRDGCLHAHSLNENIDFH